MEKDYLTSPETYRIQKTLKSAVSFEGIGLHTGALGWIRLHPAEPNHGIVFEKIDLKKPARLIAHYDAVVSTELATSLGIADRPETRIATVEHILAGLYALGVTNTRIEVRGPEIPILDGSAAPFLEGILDAGIELQPITQPVLKVLKPVKVYKGGAVCELLPRESLRLTTSIDFAHPSIGLQTFALELTPKSFQENVGSARTFGFLKDVEKLKRANLALGASLANVLAFSDTGVLNPGGPRFEDECARHKLLDALGDLSLSGCWIAGEMVSFRGGHSMHLELLKSLKQHKNHWEIIPATPIRISTPRELPQPSLRRKD